MIGHLLYGDVGLALDVVNGPGRLGVVLRKAQEHGTEGLSLDVPGVGPQDVDLYPAVDGQGGDEGLVGGAAVESDPDHPGDGEPVDLDPVGVDQLPADVGLRIGEDFRHRALLRHLALIQNGYPVTDLLDNVHLVGDDHHGDAQVLIELLQQGEDGDGGVGVQRGGGLVAQQDLGIRGKGPGNGNPLLLPAGQLGGIGLLLVLQSHDLQQVPGLLHGVGPLCADEFKREADVVQGGALHEQVKVLEDHADRLPGLPQVLVAQLCDVLAVHLDGALRGTLQQVHAADQRGFSRAGQTDDAEDLPGLDVQIDIMQSVDRRRTIPEGLAQVPDPDDGFAHRSFSPFFSRWLWHHTEYKHCPLLMEGLV